MVRGLDIFKEYFKEYADNYVIIGGTACDIIIDEAGFKPRATKDIDIILVVDYSNLLYLRFTALEFFKQAIKFLNKSSFILP